MKQYFCVGTYTEPILFGTGEVFCGKGRGVYLCALEGEHIEILQTLPLTNPSFLCLDEERRKIYAVGETKEYAGEFGGSVSEISYDAAGRMTLEHTYATGGTDPCHVAVSPDGRWLMVANFASGALSAFPLDNQGTMLLQRQLFQHEGGSVDKVRQKGPHAHSTVFDHDGMMYVADLGKDQMLCYRAEKNAVYPEPEGNVDVMPGSGPRYGEFTVDGKHFYLINEIAATVTHFLCDGGIMKPEQTVSTLPEGYEGKSICADLHLTPDGRWLYASNRGHDSLAGFRVEGDGNLTRLFVLPCGGRTPRNFAIDPTGKRLLVGNQDSDSITMFDIGDDGRLIQTGTCSFPTPVCIRFFSQTNLE